MTDQSKNTHPPLKEGQKAKKELARKEREQRLAKALRDNLAKRKTQIRSRTKDD